MAVRTGQDSAGTQTVGPEARCRVKEQEAFLASGNWERSLEIRLWVTTCPSLPGTKGSRDTSFQR